MITATRTTGTRVVGLPRRTSSALILRPAGTKPTLAVPSCRPDRTQTLCTLRYIPTTMPAATLACSDSNSAAAASCRAAWYSSRALAARCLARSKKEGSATSSPPPLAASSRGECASIEITALHSPCLRAGSRQNDYHVHAQGGRTVVAVSRPSRRSGRAVPCSLPVPGGGGCGRSPCGPQLAHSFVRRLDALNRSTAAAISM